MTFYVLHKPVVNDEAVECLRAACKKVEIPFKAINIYDFDFSKDVSLGRGDMVYRAGRGRFLRMAEYFFLKPRVSSFYSGLNVDLRNIYVLQRAEIPAPRTIYCLTKDRDILMRYVKYLGGFPVVVKALGGTRGIGVIKVDNLQTLYSLVDYLLMGQGHIVLRQFIPAKTSARMIVLGDKVIATIQYKSLKNDFRTNEALNPNVVSKKYSAQLCELAVKATQAKGLEFGGVDILISKGKPYVTEVNFPCNFVRAQNVLKQDIALQMVNYLHDKAKSL